MVMLALYLKKIARFSVTSWLRLALDSFTWSIQMTAMRNEIYIKFWSGNFPNLNVGASENISSSGLGKNIEVAAELRTNTGLRLERVIYSPLHMEQIVWGRQDANLREELVGAALDNETANRSPDTHPTEEMTTTPESSTIQRKRNNDYRLGMRC
ncbi:hypothetical protein MJO29_008062 [Puccinia striiformis f. sp. tritici]|nr:hypothetical protein MJO29_008062 [Puccinia striiformis f. sp. tritici]